MGLGGLVLAALLIAPGVHAEASKDDVAQAKILFDLGAKAYETNKYLAAISAFQQAYKLAPRDGIIFSMAQSYRRQYYTDSRPEFLRMAVEKYRDYVAKVGTAGRAADARQALAELEPLLAKLGVDVSAPPPAPVEAKPEARLMISTGVKIARISLDGGELQDMPLITEVKPIAHKIRIVADGYFDEEREIPTTEGGVVGLDIPLREKPARIVLSVADGAEVMVDGRSVGETPLAAPLDLKAGSHFIAVSVNGTKGYGEELRLKRGEKRELPVDLATTPQRYCSYAILGLGGAAVVAGAIFTGLAFSAQNSAIDISTARAAGPIAGTDLEAYNSDLDRRDAMRTVAAVGFGAGLLLGVTGLLLYGFDQPNVAAPPMRAEGQDEQAPQESKPTAPSVDVAALPVWMPGGAMGLVTVRY